MREKRNSAWPMRVRAREIRDRIRYFPSLKKIWTWHGSQISSGHSDSSTMTDGKSSAPSLKFSTLRILKLNGSSSKPRLKAWKNAMAADFATFSAPSNPKSPKMTAGSACVQAHPRNGNSMSQYASTTSDKGCPLRICSHSENSSRTSSMPQGSDGSSRDRTSSS